MTLTEAYETHCKSCQWWSLCTIKPCPVILQAKEKEAKPCLIWVDKNKEE
jgi:hypothetical protein